MRQDTRCPSSGLTQLTDSKPRLCCPASRLLYQKYGLKLPTFTTNVGVKRRQLIKNPFAMSFTGVWKEFQETDQKMNDIPPLRLRFYPQLEIEHEDVEPMKRIEPNVKQNQSEYLSDEIQQLPNATLTNEPTDENIDIKKIEADDDADLKEWESLVATMAKQAEKEAEKKAEIKAEIKAEKKADIKQPIDRRNDRKQRRSPRQQTSADKREDSKQRNHRDHPSDKSKNNGKGADKKYLDKRDDWRDNSSDTSKQTRSGSAMKNQAAKSADNSQTKIYYSNTNKRGEKTDMKQSEEKKHVWKFADIRLVVPSNKPVDNKEELAAEKAVGTSKSPEEIKNPPDKRIAEAVMILTEKVKEINLPKEKMIEVLKQLIDKMVD